MSVCATEMGTKTLVINWEAWFCDVIGRVNHFFVWEPEVLFLVFLPRLRTIRPWTFLETIVLYMKLDALIM